MMTKIGRAALVFDSLLSGSTLTLGSTMCAMLFWIFVFIVLTWYIEEIHPSGCACFRRQEKKQEATETHVNGEDYFQADPSGLHKTVVLSRLTKVESTINSERFIFEYLKVEK